MTHRNDDKKVALLTLTGETSGNIDDLEIQWLQSAGATADDVNRAWHQVFLANGATSANWNAAAAEYLTGLGYTGALPDMWAAYWAAGGGGGGGYSPLMMTFDGSSYYSGSAPTNNSRQTVVIKFKIPTFTGTSTEQTLFALRGTTTRMTVAIRSSDYSTADERGKLYVYAGGSSQYMRIYSEDIMNDGEEHVLFASFNGVTGTGLVYIDGVAHDDTGVAARVAPKTGTLSSTSVTAYVGQNYDGTDKVTGQIGYLGTMDAYLTNYLDFYDPVDGAKEIDESGWTEWGSQPDLWNKDGTMTDNKGSAGNMTANGTITGPS